jgi:pimeloyl-ACP methyl ester carboxylesterase
MVCWDQRGAGKSYSKEQANRKMTIKMMVDDAEELVKYLCGKFNKEKVHIVGHSWGSTLGVLLAQRCPQLIETYVGMGQVVDLEENENISYKFVMDEAVRLNDTKAISDLKKIGAPINGSYGNLDNLIVQRNYMTKYGGGAYKVKESIWTAMIIPVITSPEYTLYDLYKYTKGAFYCLEQLWDEVTETIRFNETVKELKMPVYITQGDHDQNTPTPLALAWFNNLKAPYKEWIAFKESAHSPIKEEPKLWGKVIKEKLFTAK